jgi:exodeoxyribonuclease III
MAGKRKQSDEKELETKKIKKSEKAEDRTVETVATVETVEPVEDNPTKGMRIVSFNVAGLYAATKKNFCENMIKLNPDIICIQETKTSIKKPGPPEIGEKLKEWKYKRFNNSEKPGYSGTAILSKHKPIAFTAGIGKSKHDAHGRVLTAEFEEFYLVTTYVPNSGQKLVNLDYRTKEWDIAFREYLIKLGESKPVIMCGDLNVAHTSIDLKNDKSNYNKSAGYTQAEIDQFDKLIEAGFMDSYRKLYPEKEIYTFWSYRGGSRPKNVGWRLDYFMLQGKSQEWLEDNIVHSDIMGSDHCPIELKIKIK